MQTNDVNEIASCCNLLLLELFVSHLCLPRTAVYVCDLKAAVHAFPFFTNNFNQAI